MDVLFACWAFDNRWIFAIKNKCLEYIFTAPLMINLATLIAVFFQSVIIQENHAKPIFLYQLLIILFLLALTDFIIIVIVRVNCQKKLKTVQIQDNYTQIMKFFHQYQQKQVLWSWIGAVLLILSVSQTFIQKLFISRNESSHSCQTNKIRYYLDLACLAYIFGIILIFLVLKGVYLVFAWGTPAQYLRFKKIIQNPT